MDDWLWQDTAGTRLPGETFSYSYSTTATATSYILSGRSWCGASYPPPVVDRAKPESCCAVLVAERLLRRHLGSAAMQDAKARGYCEVPSPSVPGRVYRVPLAADTNPGIQVVEGGRVVERLCVHPDLSYPAGDIALTQVLHIESNEAELLRLANHTPVRV